MSSPLPDSGDSDANRSRPEVSQSKPSEAAESMDQGDGLAQGFPDGWQSVFEQSVGGLRRFLGGKLPQMADVDDCLQAVMIAVLNNRREIPPAARKAWLYRVAANEAALWWRNKSTTDRVLERHAQTRDSISTDPPSLEQQETLHRIDQAIETLSENYRQVVQLRLVESMTFQAIADRLDLPLGTVLTRMRRAMERLRDQLGDRDS